MSADPATTAEQRALQATYDVAKAALSPKRAHFVEEYLVDLNATQAAIRAGYSAKSATVQGAQLLAITNVMHAVEAGRRVRSHKTAVTAEAVLAKLWQMANFDIRKLFNDDGSMKAITELDDVTAKGLTGFKITEIKDEDGNVTGYSKEGKLIDLRAVLVDVGRHLGMFDAKLRISGDKENPIALLIKQVQGNALPVVADPVDDDGEDD